MPLSSVGVANFYQEDSFTSSLVPDRQLVMPRLLQTHAGGVVLCELRKLPILRLTIRADDMNRHSAGPPRPREGDGGDPCARRIADQRNGIGGR